MGPGVTRCPAKGDTSSPSLRLSPAGRVEDPWSGVTGVTSGTKSEYFGVRKDPNRCIVDEGTGVHGRDGGDPWIRRLETGRVGKNLPTPLSLTLFLTMSRKSRVRERN